MTTSRNVLDLDAVVDRVRSHDPDLVRDRGRRPAATALVLHDDVEHGPRALFVERTTRSGDRWSGQMALPGGRREPEDDDLEDTARRETREEVDIDLAAPVGRLDDQGTRMSGVVVATFVYTLEHEPEITLEPTEVQSTVWIPLAVLADPRFSTRHPWRGVGPFPAIEYEGYTVWGLTYRIVTHFFEVATGASL